MLTNQDTDSWWILVGPQDTSVQFLFVLTNQDANPQWILMDSGGSRWILVDSDGSISTVSLRAGNQDADPWWILLVDPDGS